MSKSYFKAASGLVLETDRPDLWEGDKSMTRMSAAAGRRALEAESLARLRELLKPGDTVFTNVSRVARSGMSRHIQCFVVRDNVPNNVSGHVARVLGSPCDRRDLAVKVGGCGMDMCFHTVYSLSRVLFPDGFKCIGKGCPSNDHTNAYHYHKAGQPVPKHHRDGGYALRKRDL